MVLPTPTEFNQVGPRSANIFHLAIRYLGSRRGTTSRWSLDTPFMLGNGNSTFANVLLTFAGTILMSL
jgi:hypothetical protein